MKKSVYVETKPGRFDLLRVIEAVPVHNKDFCDSCGDCLACCDGDLCEANMDGEHYWVGYETAGEVPCEYKPVQLPPLDDLFPYEYKTVGYFRQKGVPKGEVAEMLHGHQAIEFLYKTIKEHLEAKSE